MNTLIQFCYDYRKLLVGGLLLAFPFFVGFVFDCWLTIVGAIISGVIAFILDSKKFWS